MCAKCKRPNHHPILCNENLEKGERGKKDSTSYPKRVQFNESENEKNVDNKKPENGEKVRYKQFRRLASANVVASGFHIATPVQNAGESEVLLTFAKATVVNPNLPT